MNKNTIKCKKCNHLLTTDKFDSDNNKICIECVKKTKKKKVLLIISALFIILGIASVYNVINSQEPSPKSTFVGVDDKDSLNLKQEEVGIDVEKITQPKLAHKINDIGESITNIEIFKRELEDNNTFSSVGVLFTINSESTNSEGYSLLDLYAEQYKVLGEGYSLLIEGYTCDLGTNEHNSELSKKRVSNVENYFVSKGVAVNQVFTKSYGESLYVAGSDIESSRIDNRRVNLSVVKND